MTKKVLGVIAIAILLSVVLCACGSKDISSYGGASIKEIKNAVKGEAKEESDSFLGYGADAVFCGIRSDYCVFDFSGGRCTRIEIKGEYKANKEAWSKIYADLEKRFGTPPDKTQYKDRTSYRWESALQITYINKYNDGDWIISLIFE